jgi:hypothetical protein
LIQFLNHLGASDVDLLFNNSIAGKDTTFFANEQKKSLQIIDLQRYFVVDRGIEPTKTKEIKCKLNY